MAWGGPTNQEGQGNQSYISAIRRLTTQAVQINKCARPMMTAHMREVASPNPPTRQADTESHTKPTRRYGGRVVKG
jgi:hypothetical protein